MLWQFKRGSNFWVCVMTFVNMMDNEFIFLALIKSPFCYYRVDKIKGKKENMI